MTLLACKFSWEEQASRFLQSHESRGDVLLSSSESLSVNNTVGPIVACLGLEQSHEDFLFSAALRMGNVLYIYVCVLSTGKGYFW